MDADAEHAKVLRMVAKTALDEARAAWTQARPVSAPESVVRDAYRKCVFAARALRRASEANAELEQEMIERAMILDETAVVLNRRLVALSLASA